MRLTATRRRPFGVWRLAGSFDMTDRAEGCCAVRGGDNEGVVGADCNCSGGLGVGRAVQ